MYADWLRALRELIELDVDPTLTHRLWWGCVGEVVGSPRADRCVLYSGCVMIGIDRGATAFAFWCLASRRPRE